MTSSFDRLRGGLLLALVLIIAPIASARAQALDPLELRLVRQFGLQAGLQIQGSFSARMTGPETLVEVVLYLDGEPVGVDREAPFRIDFNTAEFEPGEHRLWAEGTTGRGAPLRSAERRLIFLTAEESWGTAANYLVPVLILVAAVSVLSVIATMRAGKKGGFRLGEYGPAGGAVCRRCGLPFSRHFFAPNLLLGKLERCPHCGHWAIVPGALAIALREAEARYTADAEDGRFEKSKPEDDFLRRIEDSRFEN